jgi:thiol-disulfide isomerase/thioredoxin
MGSFELDRRSVFCGLAAGLATPQAFAEEASPIAHGALANNVIAKAFKAPPRDRLPNVTLVGQKGEIEIGALTGKTILMPLWAEWCAPCLSEIPDFSRLQAKYGNAKFEIIPILTGTRRKLAPEKIGEIFNLLHANALAALVEKNYGDNLFRAMCREGRGGVMPCNLLIAPDGTVVGREIGRVTPDDASAGSAPPSNGGDPETIRRAMAGQAQSEWGKSAGEEFARAMANGFMG